MGMKFETFAAKSRADRLRLHELTAGSTDESVVSKALVTVFPTDSNRRKKLDAWIKRGLWPIPEEELHTSNIQVTHEQESINRAVTDLESHISNIAVTDTAHEAPETEEPASQADVSDYVTGNSDVTIDHDMLEMLTAFHRSGDLAALLDWWTRTGGSQPMEKRPRFRGARSNTGLLLNVAMRQEALEKARKQDMSLSVLIEHLLWEYIGRPSKYVED